MRMCWQTVTAAVDSDRDDGRFAQIKLTSHKKIIELLARILIGRDFGLCFQFGFAIRQLERRARLQFDVDRFVHIEDRAMLAEFVLMQAGQ